MPVGVNWGSRRKRTEMWASIIVSIGLVLVSLRPEVVQRFRGLEGFTAV